MVLGKYCSAGTAVNINKGFTILTFDLWKDVLARIVQCTSSYGRVLELASSLLIVNGSKVKMILRLVSSYLALASTRLVQCVVNLSLRLFRL